MGLNTFKHYERGPMAVAEDFYAVSSRRLCLDGDGVVEVRKPPLVGMRWGEKTPNLKVEGAIAELVHLEHTVPVGLRVNGVRIALMLEEDTDERRRCDQQVQFESLREGATVTLSVSNSAAPGDFSKVEVELPASDDTDAKVIIREWRAGGLFSETKLVRLPCRGCGKYYLEITEFGAL